jgi:hypothetical protein
MTDRLTLGRERSMTAARLNLGYARRPPIREADREHEAMPTTNVVNLDAMIRRADLAAPGEAGEDVPALSVPQLERTGFLYPALRKPDFQRETAHWSPDQVADLIRACLQLGDSQISD